MLTDVLELSKVVFSQFLDHKVKLNSAKRLYKVYVALNELIDSISLVSEHYLALKFDEDFLQNSSYGSPADKWRKVLQDDLEKLNKSVETYLLSLDGIGQYDEHKSLLEEVYNRTSLHYCGTIQMLKKRYFINPCGFKLQMNLLKVDGNDWGIEYKVIDLSSYEKRLQLQLELREKAKILSQFALEVKDYFMREYTIKDLL